MHLGFCFFEFSICFFFNSDSKLNFTSSQMIEKRCEREALKIKKDQLYPYFKECF